MHLKSSMDHLRIICSKDAPWRFFLTPRFLGTITQRYLIYVYNLIDSMRLGLSDSWLENQSIVSGCQWWDNYCRHLAMSLSCFRDVLEIPGSATLLTSYLYKF